MLLCFPLTPSTLFHGLEIAHIHKTPVTSKRLSRWVKKLRMRSVCVWFNLAARVHWLIRRLDLHGKWSELCVVRRRVFGRHGKGKIWNYSAVSSIVYLTIFTNKPQVLLMFWHINQTSELTLVYLNDFLIICKWSSTPTSSIYATGPNSTP